MKQGQGSVLFFQAFPLFSIVTKEGSPSFLCFGRRRSLFLVASRGFGLLACYSVFRISTRSEVLRPSLTAKALVFSTKWELTKSFSTSGDSLRDVSFCGKHSLSTTDLRKPLNGPIALNKDLIIVRFLIYQAPCCSTRKVKRRSTAASLLGKSPTLTPVLRGRPQLSWSL